MVSSLYRCVFVGSGNNPVTRFPLVFLVGKVYRQMWKAILSILVVRSYRILWKQYVHVLILVGKCSLYLTLIFSFWLTFCFNIHVQFIWRRNCTCIISTTLTFLYCWVWWKGICVFAESAGVTMNKTNYFSDTLSLLKILAINSDITYLEALSVWWLPNKNFNTKSLKKKILSHFSGENSKICLSYFYW